MPFCRECGKEVQEDWISCPYCSEQIGPHASQNMNISDSVVGGDLTVYNNSTHSILTCPECGAQGNLKLMPCSVGGCVSKMCSQCFIENKQICAQCSNPFTKAEIDEVKSANGLIFDKEKIESGIKNGLFDGGVKGFHFWEDIGFYPDIDESVESTFTQILFLHAEQEDHVLTRWPYTSYDSMLERLEREKDCSKSDTLIFDIHFYHQMLEDLPKFLCYFTNIIPDEEWIKIVNKHNSKIKELEAKQAAEKALEKKKKEKERLEILAAKPERDCARILELRQNLFHYRLSRIGWVYSGAYVIYRLIIGSNFNQWGNEFEILNLLDIPVFFFYFYLLYVWIIIRPSVRTGPWVVFGNFAGQLMENELQQLEAEYEYRHKPLLYLWRPSKWLKL